MGIGFSNSNSDSQCEWSWTVDWSVEIIIIKHPRRFVCLFVCFKKKNVGIKLFCFCILKATLFMAHRVGKYILQKTLGEGSLGK